MAKWSIDRACGHTEVVQLYGPSRDRQRKAAWLAEQPCSSCRAAERKARHEAEAREAKIAAEQEGRPKLVGSEKQIAWAESIRHKVWQQLEQLATIARATDHPKAKVALAAIEAIKAERAAAWWIDRRESSAERLVKQKMAAIQ